MKSIVNSPLWWWLMKPVLQCTVAEGKIWKGLRQSHASPEITKSRQRFRWAERRVDLPNCDLYHMEWLGFFCGSSPLCGWAVDLDYPWLFWLDTLHFPVLKPQPGSKTAAISHAAARLGDFHLQFWKKNSFLELAENLQSPEVRDLGVRDQNSSPSIALNPQALVQFDDFLSDRIFTTKGISYWNW